MKVKRPDLRTGFYKSEKIGQRFHLFTKVKKLDKDFTLKEIRTTKKDFHIIFLLLHSMPGY